MIRAGDRQDRDRRERDLRAYYDDEICDRAARDTDPERAIRCDRFRSLATAQGCRTILEVGCGAGRDGLAFALAGLDYVGVDVSSESVRHCFRLGLRVQQASVLSLPFDDATFDAGWTMSTLLHIADEDLLQALAEIARVLKEGSPLAVGLWGGTPREELYRDGSREDQHGFSRSDRTTRFAVPWRRSGPSTFSRHGSRPTTTRSFTTSSPGSARTLRARQADRPSLARRAAPNLKDALRMPQLTLRHVPGAGSEVGDGVEPAGGVVAMDAVLGVQDAHVRGDGRGQGMAATMEIITLTVEPPPAAAGALP